jgi:hypothetical protein
MRDDRLIKQTKIKKIVAAQRVIGLGKNNDEHKYFCGGNFLDL